MQSCPQGFFGPEQSPPALLDLDLVSPGDGHSTQDLAWHSTAGSRGLLAALPLPSPKPVRLPELHYVADLINKGVLRPEGGQHPGANATGGGKQRHASKGVHGSHDTIHMGLTVTWTGLVCCGRHEHDGSLITNLGTS